MSTFARLITLLIAISFLNACSDKASTNPSTDTQELPKIGLVMKSLANEFFVNMATQAKKHQQENASRYSLLVNGTKNESDLAQQVALIDQMIASGMQAIVLAPADSKAVVPAVVRAVKAGLIVINIDNRLDQATLSEYGVSVPFVGPDNMQGAFLAAEYAAQKLSANDQVVVLEGIPSAINSQQRRDGFVKAIEQYGLNMVALQSADWEQTKAAQVASSLLIQYPEVKAIFAANDNMALGALAAVNRANLTSAPIIVGFDNIQALTPHIESGDILATVDQFGGKLAVFGIEKALSALNGDALDDVTQTPLSLITKETIDTKDTME
ncbi:substrate-binding domain-containing protein [Glaciecola siphonariae]|uniref:Substrate-binding domain-containing protein n=1 Tax=Glaciecola siphonariae TaxID=521012 RepID=A0ABV9LX78_9ALTE